MTTTRAKRWRLAAITGSGFLSYAAAVLADNPIAFYPLNTANCINVVTATNNGAGVNNPTQVASIIRSLAQSWNFVGASSQFVDVTEAIAWPAGNAARTVEAWIRTSTASSPLFSYGTGATNFVMRVEGGALSVDYGGGVTDAFGSGLNNGNIHHVAITHDGANVRGYIDGVAVGVPSARVLATVVGASIWIATQGAVFATSVIGGVAIFPSALSAARIAAHYAAGRA